MHAYAIKQNSCCVIIVSHLRSESRILADWDNVLLSSWQMGSLPYQPYGLLPFCGPIALFCADPAEKLSLAKTLRALSLKSEIGRERSAPSHAAERSDPWVALLRSLASWGILRLVPVFVSVIELILLWFLDIKFQGLREKSGCSLVVSERLGETWSGMYSVVYHLCPMIYRVPGNPCSVKPDHLEQSQHTCVSLFLENVWSVRMWSLSGIVGNTGKLTNFLGSYLVD